MNICKLYDELKYNKKREKSEESKIIINKKIEANISNDILERIKVQCLDILNYDGWVYVVYFRKHNVYKIGYTAQNIYDRINQLVNRYDDQPELIYGILLNSLHDVLPKELESFMHKYFCNKKDIKKTKNTEYFKLSIKDLLLIKYFFEYVEGEEIIYGIKKHLQYLGDKIYSNKWWLKYA